MFLKWMELYVIVVEGIEVFIECVVEWIFIGFFEVKVVCYVVIFFLVGGIGDFLSRAFFFIIDVEDGVT